MAGKPEEEVKKLPCGGKYYIEKEDNSVLDWCAIRYIRNDFSSSVSATCCKTDKCPETDGGRDIWTDDIDRETAIDRAAFGRPINKVWSKWVLKKTS